jgi:hypothetical protein
MIMLVLGDIEEMAVFNHCCTWWLVVGGCWLVIGGWWLVVGG